MNHDVILNGAVIPLPVCDPDSYAQIVIDVIVGCAVVQIDGPFVIRCLVKVVIAHDIGDPTVLFNVAGWM